MPFQKFFTLIIIIIIITVVIHLVTVDKKISHNSEKILSKSAKKEEE